MKKISTFLLAMLFCLMVPFGAMAQDTKTTDSEVQYFEDGSYTITTYEEMITPFSSGSAAKGKSVTRYTSDNEKVWSVTLWATFTYTGSSATCTKASTTYVIYDSAWKITKNTASKSGRTATADFVMKKYWLGIITYTVPGTITLTCDNNGNIS